MQVIKNFWHTYRKAEIWPEILFDITKKDPYYYLKLLKSRIYELEKRKGNSPIFFSKIETQY